MTPTGTLDHDGATLVLTRQFAAPIDDVWASVTESERLARWFGAWSGDPTAGFVMVTMNAEAEPVPAVRYDIHACEPPRLLAVSATDDFGHWRLTAELSHAESGTTLVLRQEEVDLASLPDTGPGWEWYLDRLVAAVAGEEPPTLTDFEHTYLPMRTTYAAMTEPHGGAPTTKR